MKNLADLNDLLFKELDALTRADASDEYMEKEVKKANAINGIATTIINNGNLVLKSAKMLNEYGIETPPESLPGVAGLLSDSISADKRGKSR